MSKILKIILSVIAVLIALYIAWFFYVNTSYVADIAACRIPSQQCDDAETGKVNYDSMDGVYHIHELYAGKETIPLEDSCIVSKETGYYAKCEDKGGNIWNVSLFETRI